MIKAIIFDLGGVVVPENGESIDRAMADNLGLDFAVFRERIFDLKKLATVGRLSLAGVYSELAKKIDAKIDPHELVKKHLELYKNTCAKRDSDVLEVIKNLKQKYKVICLTNTEIEIAEFNKKNGLFDYFDKAYLSTELGLMKPHKEIYEKVLNDLNCRPHEVLLIDDKFDNNKAAEDIGMRTIAYTNPDQLRGDLKLLNNIA